MLNFFVIFLGIVDLVGAILHVWPMPGDLMLAISLILMIKGIWSIISSLSHGFFYDVLGLIDFIAGLILIIVNFGTPLSYGWVIGALLGLKALYTVVTSMSLTRG